MDNEQLLKKAREVGFDFESSGMTTVADGTEAVLLPRDLEALKRLEDVVPTLYSVETRFHHFVLRADVAEATV